MTVDQVREWVETIRNKQNDPETAHVEEDGLYEALLTAIANGECDDPAWCAKEALKSQDIDFPRWYA